MGQKEGKHESRFSWAVSSRFSEQGQIKGINLECNFVDDNVYGKKADAKFISDIALKNLGITLEDLLPLINSEVDLELNFKGKVVGIKKLS